MSFWGPNMRRVIVWAEEHGIPSNIAPIEFADRMDKLTGIQTLPNAEPEEAAAQWLRAIEGIERSQPPSGVMIAGKWSIETMRRIAEEDDGST